MPYRIILAVVLCFGMGASPALQAETFGLEQAQNYALEHNPDLLAARGGHSATLLYNGLVLLAGGYAIGAPPLVTTELYDPINNTMTPGPR